MDWTVTLLCMNVDLVTLSALRCSSPMHAVGGPLNARTSALASKPQYVALRHSGKLPVSLLGGPELNLVSPTIGRAERHYIARTTYSIIFLYLFRPFYVLQLSLAEHQPRYIPSVVRLSEFLLLTSLQFLYLFELMLLCFSVLSDFVQSRASSVQLYRLLGPPQHIHGFSISFNIRDQLCSLA